ncbi:hypothetical protein C0J52_25892, partial [Blattella germanica]
MRNSFSISQMVLFASASSANFLLHLVASVRRFFLRGALLHGVLGTSVARDVSTRPQIFSSAIESSVVVVVAPAPCGEAVSDSTSSSDPNTKISLGITILTILEYLFTKEETNLNRTGVSIFECNDSLVIFDSTSVLYSRFTGDELRICADPLGRPRWLVFFFGGTVYIQQSQYYFILLSVIRNQRGFILEAEYDPISRD